MFKATGRTLLAAFALLFLITGCTGGAGKTKEELLREGMKLLNGNNPRGAVVLFKNALEKDQNFFEARFQLARAYYGIGNFDSAEKELQKVIRQSPSLKDARILLARAYLQKSMPDNALKMIPELSRDPALSADVSELAGWANALKGDYAKAVQLLRQAVSGGDGRPSARILLARAYIATGEKGAAAEQVGKVLEREPSHADALFILAGLQVSENNTDAALRTYERIIKAHPQAAEAYFKKGLLFVQKKQLDEALALADTMISKLPNRPQGHSLKGIVLFHKRNLNEAMVALQKSLAISPLVNSYYFLGLCHYYRDELEQAMSQFQRALDLNPSFEQARILVSLILLRQKRTDDTITEIKKVIGANKENAVAHNILGSAYVEKGRYEEGMEEFDKAISIDPKLADAHIRRGLLHLNRGRVRDAEADLKTAVQVDPAVLNTRLFLGSYYMRLKNYEAAVRTLREGLNNSKRDAVLYTSMAAALTAEGKHAEAVRCLQKAKETDPDYLAASFALAACHVARGNHDKAIEEYRGIIKRAPNDARAIISTASLLELKGREQEALGYYKKAKETKDPAGYIALANYFVRKKEINKAVNTLDEVLKTDQRNAEFLELKGRVYLDSGKYKEALRSFESLEAVSPDKAFPLVIQTHILSRDYKAALKKVEGRMQADTQRLDLMAEASRIHLMMGNRQKAVECAQDIIRQKPDAAFGYLVLAFVYENSGEPDRAIDTLRNGFGTRRDRSRMQQAESMRMMLAGLYAKKKDYKLAISTYDGVLKDNPGNVPALFAQGTLYSLVGRNEEAVKRYLRVIEKSGNHVPALNNLAYLYAEGYGSKADALKFASKAYSLAPENGSVMDTLGLALVRNGRAEEAQKILEKAALLAPNSPTIYYHIALARKGQGDRARAVENLQRAIRMGEFPEAHDARLLLSELQDSSGPAAK